MTTRQEASTATQVSQMSEKSHSAAQTMPAVPGNNGFVKAKEL